MTAGPGQTLSHYRIIDEISRGGMGIVFRAVDIHLNREVALKVLPTDLVRDPDRRQRFVQEAQAASALEHPHIAVIHEIGAEGDISFIAMELIRGEKLSELLAAAPLPAARALDLGIEVAEGLTRAHERGVIHRDLKPANVMVTGDGHAKIIDFGLAKLIAPLAGDAPATTIPGGTDPGVVLGTVSYMSPEQARGGRIDHRTDIFSFGILLHEMLAGHPPFRAPSGVETLHSIMNAPPPPLPALGGLVAHDAHAEIQRIRDKCLAKAPEDRYQGMKDLVVDLRGARRRLESSAFAAAPAIPRRSARAWWVAGAAVVGVVAAGVATTRFWPQGSTPDSGKPSVAVLYFENNTGNASLDWLRTGLTDMMVTDLSQSPNLEVLSTDRLHQILSEMRRADDRSVSFDVVRELATRAGVQTVLAGSYVKAGEVIRINLRLQEAESGRILSAERAESLGESNLFRTVDELTRRVKARLELPAAGSAPSGLFAPPTTVSSSTPGGVDRDLREVTTASIEAYRYYAEGVNLHERLRDAESIPLFEKALAIDPTFALAMLKLAVVHSNQGHPSEADEYARRAFEHADRVTTRERHYIEGFHYARRQDTLVKAIDAYERGLKLYPDHASVRNNLALIYAQLERAGDAIPHFEELRRRGMTFPGSYAALAFLYGNREEFDRGEEVLRQYLNRHADNASAQASLGSLYVAWGRLDDALAAFERAEALDAFETDAQTGRWEVHVLRGQWAEADVFARQLAGSQDPFRRWLGHRLAAAGHLYRGRSAEALASLEQAARAYARPGPLRAQARARAAHVLLARGQAAPALASAEQARRDAAGSGAEWNALQVTALAQLAAGRAAEADRTLEELTTRAEQLPSEREVRRVHHLAGQLALARGDRARALRELTEAQKRLPLRVVPPPAADNTSFAIVTLELGSLHLEAGRLDEAERSFRRILDSTRERVYWPIEYVRSLYMIGLLYEKRGDMEKAHEAYRRYLDHWRAGDLDRARVAEVERKLRAAVTQ